MNFRNEKTAKKWNEPNKTKKKPEHSLKTQRHYGKKSLCITITSRSNELNNVCKHGNISPQTTPTCPNVHIFLIRIDCFDFDGGVFFSSLHGTDGIKLAIKWQVSNSICFLKSIFNKSIFFGDAFFSRQFSDWNHRWMQSGHHIKYH